MEPITSIKEDFKKTVLLYLFPGIVVSWPYLIAFLRYEQQHHIIRNFDIEHLEVLLYLLVIIVFYGIGHFMNKLGNRLEVWIEEIFNRKNKTEFENAWDEYLKTYFSKDKEPVIIRYYSNFIVSYKYELTLIWCILVMYISIVYLQYHLLLHFHHLFMSTIFWISLSSFIYLLYEACVGMKQAHKLRQIIIEMHKETR